MTKEQKARKLLREIYDEIGPKVCEGGFRPAPLKEYIKNPKRWDFDVGPLMLKVAKFLANGP